MSLEKIRQSQKQQYAIKMFHFVIYNQIIYIMTLNSTKKQGFKTCIIAFLFCQLETIQSRDIFGPKERHFVNKDIVNQIKRANTSWVPYEPEANPFRNRTDDDIRRLFGLKQPDDVSPIQARLFRNKRQGQHHEKRKSQLSDEEKQRLRQEIPVQIPDSFDARTQWPNCIHDVRDQMSCGSCWAFSTAGFLEDRFCIATNGAITTRLSPQDLITCDHQNMGCNGGFLTPAMNYAIYQGLVSDDCMPYRDETGYCTYQCSDKSQSFKKYHCKPGSLKMLTETVDIMLELMTNGPMQVGFTVYTDFMNYYSGIYQYVYGWNEGGHAVKLIGWNYDADRLYWILQNQWGDNWGENGYFNVYAGEVGLDSTAFSCDPDLDQIL